MIHDYLHVKCDMCPSAGTGLMLREVSQESRPPTLSQRKLLRQLTSFHIESYHFILTISLSLSLDLDLDNEQSVKTLTTCCD